MVRKLLAVGSMLAVAGMASADITNIDFVHVFEGNLPDSGIYVSSWDLVVTIEGDDAWTIAGGRQVGEPWIWVCGATFYQDPVGSDTQPNPVSFEYFPDLQYDSFYTTHLGWPNTPDQGTAPSFAFGPINEPTRLIADWWLTPDGNFYPGDFTIARVTVVPDDEDWWCGEFAVQIGSLEQLLPLLFEAMTGCCPGDLDGDCDVDLSDLAQLLANYGTTSEATYWDGDLDGDDDVDLEDLAELLSVYGTDC